MTKDKIRAIIDTLWDDFLKNSNSKEFNFINQINVLLFLRIIDEIEEQYGVYCEQNSLPMRALFFAKDQQKFRWKSLQCLNESELYSVVKQELFPFLKNFTSPSTIKSSSYQEALAGTLEFPIFESVLSFFPLLAYIKPQIFNNALMLHAIVTSIQQISFEKPDIKAFFYEYLLSKSEVINGLLFPQERIQQLMIELVNPEAEEYIANPACMTGNFLMQILRYFNNKNIKLSQNNLHGFESKIHFSLCASMNMIMHNKKEQCIKIKNFFSHDKAHVGIPKKYDVVICNPWDLYFDDEDELKEHSIIKNILEILTINGRCAILVPEALLFDRKESTLLHKLVDKNTIEAVISLHPDLYGRDIYNKLAILLFKKGGVSKEILFYQLESLNESSTTKNKDVFSEALTTWQKYKNDGIIDFDRKSKCFIIEAEEIRQYNYDLRFGRYKEPEYTSRLHPLTNFEFILIRSLQALIVLLFIRRSHSLNMILYKKIIDTIFFKMFGNPITNLKNWEVKKLEDLCDIIDDIKPLKRSYSRLEYNKPIPYLTFNDMMINHKYSSELSVFSFLPQKISKSILRGDTVSLKNRKIQCVVPASSIVFNVLTSSYNEQQAASLAKLSSFLKVLSWFKILKKQEVNFYETPSEYRTLQMWMTDDREITLSEGMKALAIKNTTIISSKFLCYYLYYASPLIIEKMKLVNPNEKDYLNVDMEILKTFPIFLPPIELQKKFEKKISHMEKDIDQILTKLLTLRTLSQQQ